MEKSTKTPVNLVLCWHMHQPWYRESEHGDYRLPWVYLHALKDYVDMAAHLEAHPKMRCVVNFTPVLLEQIDDYASQFKQHLDKGSRFCEPLLNLLSGVDDIPPDNESRAEIVRACRDYGVEVLTLYAFSIDGLRNGTTRPGAARYNRSVPSVGVLETRARAMPASLSSSSARSGGSDSHTSAL